MGGDEESEMNNEMNKKWTTKKCKRCGEEFKVGVIGGALAKWCRPCGKKLNAVGAKKRYKAGDGAKRKK